MSHFYNRYYPTICIRRAEMRAMEKLPATEKAEMLPVTLLAPWLNSINFDNTHNVVKKSLEEVHTIVDLDRHFQSSSSLPSREYFRSLLNGDQGAEEWMNLVEAHSTYIPSILFPGVSDEGVRTQIVRARSLGRGYVFRIDLSMPHEISRILSYVEQHIEEDILTIFDYGYNDDELQIASNVAEYIRKLINVSPDAKFVISGADFPNNFSSYDNFANVKRIASRGVFGILAQTYGNYQMYYGDWASTKPRRYDGGGSRPLPRVDFPTKTSWIIARSKEDEWSFQDAALRITRLAEWEKRPMVWGAGMIEKTALGLPGGISTGPEAIAARVNMHLFLQSHFSDQGAPPVPEGAWVDPI